MAAIVFAQYRPGWRPGAANRTLVRKYRTLRGQIDVQALKRKEALKRIKVKKDIKKPALIINKVDGEYTVQMEVMKVYSHERLPFQYPFEDKPPVMFAVGRTAQENDKRQRKKDRRERRKMRRQRQFIQSEFRNMCKEMCLKTYQEAIGVLPCPNPNDPNCPCFPNKPDLISPTADSCSCSDSGNSSSGSETDGDDWVIEFTPPTAKFDPDSKRPPILNERESQYNHNDFKVKLLDKNGQPVPRFFIGPDGKQVCSDLGGFWGPDGRWLEIGKDGYIGPDGRWIPMTFIGPDGSIINAEDGVFTDAYGRTFTIGVDGYIGPDGTWIFYPPGPKIPPFPPGTKSKSEESVWTCFGDITASQLALLQFKPHGPDRKKLRERLKERERETGSTEPSMPRGKIVPRFRKGKMIDPPHSKTDIKQSLVTFKDEKGKSRGRSGATSPTKKSGMSSGGQEISKGTSKGSRSPNERGGKSGASSPTPRGTGVGGKGSGGVAGNESGGVGGKRSAGVGGKSSGGVGNSKLGGKPGSPQSGASKKGSPDRDDGGGFFDGEGIEGNSRQAALNFLTDRKNAKKLESMKICKLARMAADGRHISGHHKDCYGQSVGGCCEEQGGICTEIFAIAHEGVDQSSDTGPVKKSRNSVDNTAKASSQRRSSSGGGKTSKKSGGKSAGGKSAGGMKSEKASSKSTRFEDSPDTGDVIDRRAAAIKMLKDKKNILENKKICKLARMTADGRHISGHHKDCFDSAVGACCEEKGGVCTEIFAQEHNK